LLTDNLQRKGCLPNLNDKLEKIYFIKGLMDSDGWISKRKNGKYIKYEIGFKNTSLLSPRIYDLMSNVGLQCGKLNYKTCFRYNKKTKPVWTWTINPGNYISKVGFSIARKKTLLKSYFEDRNAKKNTSF